MFNIKKISNFVEEKNFLGKIWSNSSFHTPILIKVNRFLQTPLVFWLSAQVVMEAVDIKKKHSIANNFFFEASSEIIDTTRATKSLLFEYRQFRVFCILFFADLLIFSETFFLRGYISEPTGDIGAIYFKNIGARTLGKFSPKIFASHYLFWRKHDETDVRRNIFAYLFFVWDYSW